MNNTKILKSVVQGLLALVLVIFVFSFIVSDWTEIRRVLLESSKSSMLISFLLFSSGSLMLAWTWHLMMNVMGSRSSALDNLWAVYLGGMGKYVPGKIWGATMRIVLSKQAGISEMTSGAGILVESYLLVITSAIVVSIGLVQWPEPLSGWVRWLTIPMLFSIVLLHPRLLAHLLRLMNKILPRFIKIPSMLPGFHQFLTISWLYLSLWVLWGAGFYFSLNAIHPLQVDDFVTIISGNTLAWLTGFISFFTPAGLGVRELILVSVLSGRISISEVAAAAVLSRFFMILGELTGVGGLFLLRRTR